MATPDEQKTIGGRRCGHLKPITHGGTRLGAGRAPGEWVPTKEVLKLAKK